MMIPIIEQVIQSIESIQEALKDGICSDTCGYMSESEARLEHAKELLATFTKHVNEGTLLGPPPKDRKKPASYRVKLRDTDGVMCIYAPNVNAVIAEFTPGTATDAERIKEILASVPAQKF